MDKNQTAEMPDSNTDRNDGNKLRLDLEKVPKNQFTDQIIPNNQGGNNSLRKKVPAKARGNIETSGSAAEMGVETEGISAPGLPSQIMASNGQGSEPGMSSERQSAPDSEEMTFEQFKKMKHMQKQSPGTKKKKLINQKSQGIIQNNIMAAEMVLKPSDDFGHVTESDDDKNTTNKLEQLVAANESSNALIVEPITQIDDSRTTKQDFNVRKTKKGLTNARESKVAPLVQKQINSKLRSTKNKVIDTGGSDAHYAQLDQFSSISPFQKSQSISLPLGESKTPSDQNMLPATQRGTFKSKVQYKSRNDNKYDDSDSLDNSESEEEPEEKQDNQVKHGMSFLKSQELRLQQQMDQNRQLMEIERQKIAIGANSDQDVKPNKRFKNYNQLFSGLTKSKNVPTMFPLVTCMITYDSLHAVTVTKKDDHEYYVKQYSLETYALTFEEKIGGSDTQYIKLKEVEQNSRGNKYAIAYMDDGKFFIRTFGKTTRTPEEIAEEEFDVNAALKLDNFTMPIDNFPDPFITCCFVNDDILFVNLYHSFTCCHYHFFYDSKNKVIIQKRVERQVLEGSNDKNFPYKCFMSDEEHEVFSFYRQGQAFRIPIKNIAPRKFTFTQRNLDDDKQSYYLEKIYDKDLGKMFLVNGKALITQCSSQILFFKLKMDEFTKERSWYNYWKIDVQGSIYFIKGNKRVQITTSDRIYFYLIDPITFEPTLENVMYNFMGCSEMMFGSRVRYCITYKTNQKSFDIYRRKYIHDFKLNVVSQNMDGSRGLPIESMGAFLVSKIDEIHFYDMDTFQEMPNCCIKIPLLKSEEREPNQIISMQASQNEDYIAVISGKNLIMNQQFANQLFIFKRIFNISSSNEPDNWMLQKRIVTKTLPQFVGICMQFEFKLAKPGHDPTQLIFARQDKIFILDFVKEQMSTLVEFDMPLFRQPEFFLMNDDQTVSIIASQDDGIYYNLRNKFYFDLDEHYKISNIKEVYHDHEDRVFYLLANKYQGKLGLFLIIFDEFDPRHHQFFLKYKNKLDIADADVFVVRNQKKQYKELIVGFKSISVNTYTLMVSDISTEKKWMQFRHESFQLWESKVKGFYLSKNNDFVTINSEGINVYSLGSYHKKPLVGEGAQDKMIHSLESCNYLKIDKTNQIFYSFAGENKLIKIMQQHRKQNNKTGDENFFDQIYHIRIHEITLRELLLLQSMYVSNTMSDILQIVCDQPRPDVFFKSFLELDGQNMASILAFDSRSIHRLLDQDLNKEFFIKDSPVFYRNKLTKSNNQEKYFYRSAIDNAIRNNQIRAVSHIIDYMVIYQNNYTSSFLFGKVMHKLINKGVEVSTLFNSQIFAFQFDYDEWPSTHTDDNSYMRPYNGSIFDLRKMYSEIFFEDHFQVNDELEDNIDSSKLYKVSYTVNMLPTLSEYIVQDADGNREIINEGVDLVNECIESDELAIFESENFQQVIVFKWEQFGRFLHLRGCFFHFFYMIILCIYINQVYINANTDGTRIYQILLIVAIIYPFWYESTQMVRLGVCNYLSEAANYLDLLYIYGGISNVILQNLIDPMSFINKLLMTIILLQQIYKTFFFLRIFDSLSYIVTMIQTVISDLKVFMLFYTILVFLFSMIFAVLCVGNPKVPGAFKEYLEEIEQRDELDQPENTPMEEYQNVGLFLGYIFSTLRSSLGDFDFEASNYLEPSENYLYWFIWLLSILLSCIIFLNFIIAETSASYESIKKNLNKMKFKEKSSLVTEAENMLFDRQKNNINFPKYIIKRSIQN